MSKILLQESRDSSVSISIVIFTRHNVTYSQLHNWTCPHIEPSSVIYKLSHTQQHNHVDIWHIHIHISHIAHMIHITHCNIISVITHRTPHITHTIFCSLFPVNSLICATFASTGRNVTARWQHGMESGDPCARARACVMFVNNVCDVCVCVCVCVCVLCWSGLQKKKAAGNRAKKFKHGKRKSRLLSLLSLLLHDDSPLDASVASCNARVGVGQDAGRRCAVPSVASVRLYGEGGSYMHRSMTACNCIVALLVLQKVKKLFQCCARDWALPYF